MRQITVNPKDRPAHVDPGPAPMLQWIRIEQLVVDDSYQRELKPGNWSAIRRIAAQFKWSRFSPVFVAPIEGGRFAIIDGQHRTHAAAICGFAEVPCQVVQMNHEEQAASFAAVNGLVTKVTQWQIYKAALAAGVSWAKECNDAVTAAGARLMTGNSTAADKKAGDVYALGLIRSHVAAGRAGVVTAALSALRRAECGEIPEYWTGSILKIWLQAVADRPALIRDGADLAGFLDDFDLCSAYDNAEEAAKKKRRLGFAAVTRYDLAVSMIVEALDGRFAAVAA